MSVEEDMDVVVQLASTVSDAKDEDIPLHLLKIRYLLQQHPELSREQQLLKQNIFKYDLLSWCSVVLKYDFTKIEDGYRTAASIIDILFECCVGINLKNFQEFCDSTLPDALHSSLLVAWQIQQLYLEKYKQHGDMKYGIHAEELATLKTQYNSIIDSVVKVTTSQTFLVVSLLKSDNLIRILIEETSDAVNMVITALNLVLRGIRMNPISIRSIPTVSLNHLLDELIYKVTTSECDDLASVTIRILVAMVDADSELANKLSVRFKGLKALMTRWLGHGFDRILKNLIAILDAGNAQIAELARRTHAVKTIWAAYSGWKTRSRVGKLHKVVPSLQSSFRRKRQEKLEHALKEKLRIEQQHSTEMARKRSIRSTREKQLQMLEIVPAGKIDKHIQDEEQKAVVKIQSHWRGSMNRKRYADKQNFHRTSMAAIVIQRAARRLLARRQKMKQDVPKSLTLQHKLTKERREELQLIIDQRRAVRDKKEITAEEANDIHHKTQRRLLAYHTQTVEKSLHIDPKLEGLLAKLRTEQELLQNIPSLSEVTPELADSLAYTSTAVVMAAESEHKRMMKELNSQWWQKLSLKTGENLNPFDDKSKPVSDVEMQEIEDFLNPNLKRNVLF